MRWLWNMKSMTQTFEPLDDTVTLAFPFRRFGELSFVDCPGEKFQTETRTLSLCARGYPALPILLASERHSPCKGLARNEVRFAR
jgi:hypothetical protein